MTSLTVIDELNQRADRARLDLINEHKRALDHARSEVERFRSIEAKAKDHADNWAVVATGLESALIAMGATP